MAGQNDFKHIKVNSDSDDELVIVAGIVSGPSDEAHVCEDEDDGAVVDSGEGAFGPDKSDLDVPAEPKRPDASPSDGYRPTTLDDIESSKMPKAQLAVIVAAIAALAAFIIWYVVFS